MENCKRRSFEETLNQYLSESKEIQLDFLKSKDFALKLFNYDNNFYGSFQRVLMVVKKKIACFIHDFEKGNNEQKCITSLRQSLKNLTLDSENVLNDGIIAFYEDIIEKKEKQKGGSKEKDEFVLLYERILSAMQILLRYYFVNKEYKEQERKELQSQGGNSKRGALSQREMNKKVEALEDLEKEIEENEEDRKLIRIWERMKEESIENMFNNYIKKEQSVISTTIQICRICSEKIYLKNLQKHVNFCSKKHQIKLKLNEISQRHNFILQSFQQQQEAILKKKFKGEKSKSNEHFLKIFKLIKENDPTVQMKRRSSLVGEKTGYILDRLEEEIQSYAQLYGENFLLRQASKSFSEKFFLEKKLENLQRNFLNSEANNISESGSLLSLGSFNPSPATNFKTKKSIFAHLSQSSSKSSESKSSCSIEEEQRDEELFSSIRSKLNSKNKKKTIESPIQSQTSKLWKSMSQIKISHQQDDKKINDINLNSFKILKFLGKGAFGRVYLAKRIDTTDLYALKIIKIHDGQNEKDINLIKNEHEIFKKIGGDHLVKAPFSFSQDSGHFFVLEYLPGGDLGKILLNEVYLEEKQAQFYLAEIVLAIQHLHLCGIIHRDLKPENLVIDADGHLKLTDFGLSEIQIAKKITGVNQFQPDLISESRRGRPINRRIALVNRSNSQTKLIGTPDYIAPEIINRISTDNMSIDWWSLGVIAYELMVGCRPFCGQTLEQVINNIKKFSIEWPEVGEEEGMISEKAKDLIIRLLDRNFKGRLGADDVNDIKNHQFFEGIDWKNIKKQKPPILPDMQSQQTLKSMDEDPLLRSEIEELLKMNCKVVKNNVKLEKFVRYDILKTETIESAGRKVTKKGATLKKLMSIAQKLTNPHEDYAQSCHRISENLQPKLGIDIV